MKGPPTFVPIISKKKDSNSSMKRLNKVKDRGQPYFTPIMLRMSSESNLGVQTWLVSVGMYNALL